MSSLHDSPFQILLYYHYTTIEEPSTFREEHHALCERLHLLGRILVSEEGINGTVSGETKNTQAYIEALHNDPRFKAMPFKIDPSEGHIFSKLSVKLRPELVRLGLKEKEDIDPRKLSGTRLAPAQWKEMLEAGGEDLVILDGRNQYEFDIGHFRGAACPDIDNFREFPEWFRKHRSELEGRRVMTYCTGGVRCEKLSGFLLQEGIEEVYQLEGGIISYGHDPKVKGTLFDGACYVFDKRIAVDVNHTETSCIVSNCEVCGEKSDRYTNCSHPPCNRQHFRCEKCEEREGRACSPDCEKAVGIPV